MFRKKSFASTVYVSFVQLLERQHNLLFKQGYLRQITNFMNLGKLGNLSLSFLIYKTYIILVPT